MPAAELADLLARYTKNEAMPLSITTTTTSKLKIPQFKP